MDYTKTLETPVGKHKVVIKTLVTGKEREQIDNAVMTLLKTTDGGKTFECTDTTKLNTVHDHVLLTVSVISIDEDTTTCFERLQSMFEPDYKFVLDAVKEEQKKMMDTMSA